MKCKLPLRLIVIHRIASLADRTKTMAAATRIMFGARQRIPIFLGSSAYDDGQMTFGQHSSANGPMT
jgi:hypothetical protein